jgi:hypothetical protein
MRLGDLDALKFSKVAEVNGVLTHVLTAEDINNAPTVEYPFYQEAYQSGYEEGYLKGVKVGKEYERPQGEWIFDREFTEFGNPYGTYRCSVCGGHSSNKYSFCKDCGASMKPKTCTNCKTFGHDCGDCEVGDDD